MVGIRHDLKVSSEQVPSGKGQKGQQRAKELQKQRYFEWRVKSASVYVESATECSGFEQLAPDRDEEEI